MKLWAVLDNWWTQTKIITNSFIKYHRLKYFPLYTIRRCNPLRFRIVKYIIKSPVQSFSDFPRIVCAASYNQSQFIKCIQYCNIAFQNMWTLIILYSFRLHFLHGHFYYIISIENSLHFLSVHTSNKLIFPVVESFKSVFYVHYMHKLLIKKTNK